jgi:hypothetical protein
MLSRRLILLMVTLVVHFIASAAADGSGFVDGAGGAPKPTCGVSGFCYIVPNKEWPLPPSHCQELDNPGGNASAFWANHSSKYTYAIGWRNGTCDRSMFNVVNKVDHNYDNYVDVTLWYLGMKH